MGWLKDSIQTLGGICDTRSLKRAELCCLGSNRRDLAGTLSLEPVTL
jgi:hypothetical protein